MNAVTWTGLVSLGLSALVFGAVMRLRRRPRARLSYVTGAARHKAVRRSGARQVVARIEHLLVIRPGLAVTAAVGITAAAAWTVGGPAAAAVASLYAVVAVFGVRVRIVRRRVDRAYTAMLDAIDAAVGDLRAGLVPAPGTRATASVRGADPFLSAAAVRLEAAYRISEALGTPLADLLDRVDADLRAGQRLRATVDAQVSGARATSALLLGMPVAGLLLGTGLGVDPVAQLLHTSLGATCALTAASLQCAGMLWTGRIVDGAVAEVR